MSVGTRLCFNADICRHSLFSCRHSCLSAPAFLQAARELNKSFRELVTYLTLDLTSDLAKVRAVFTWMGGQDIVNSGDTYSSYPAPNSPEMLMKRAAEGENASFVNLFALLCR